MTSRGMTISRRGFIAAGTAALAAPVFIRNARAQEKFDTAGRLTDETTRRFLGRFLESFVEWIGRFPVAS